MPIPSAPRVQGFATVLLAVDDFDASTGAIGVARELACNTGAELVVLSVLPVSQGLELMGLDARAVEEERTISMVERIVDEARSAGAKARPLTTRGKSPAEVIIATAKDLHVDVIVVGRRGRNDLARAMLGDVTARVIGGASCPVLVVPRAATYSKKRILLATDGSPASERAARMAGLCAKLVALPVTVLSVEVPTHPSERQAEARRIVDRTVAEFQAHHLDVTGKVTQGSAPDEIMRVATESAVDLIVLGSEGRSGLGRMMLGANCQAVIGRSTCPVLVATAQMAEYPQSSKPKPPPATTPAVHKAEPVRPPRRTFLVVADDTEEMRAAVDYASRRAHATGGTVAILRIRPESELAAAAPRGTSAADLEKEARAAVSTIASEIERVLGEKPMIYTRWGDPSQQVLGLLASEPGIDALVLAASNDPRGPGPLIIELVTQHAAMLPVPLMIVPGKPIGR